MFDISYQDPDDPKKKLHAYQNSWGLTTRTIGVMVMVHGDDRGLVLPPMVAALQVVIVLVGINAKTSAEDRVMLHETGMDYYMQLKKDGVRVKLDDSDWTSGKKNCGRRGHFPAGHSVSAVVK
jgi:prolyl-tRNA synthetase